MSNKDIKRATIGRLPQYLRYITALPQEITTVSATGIAKALELGEVQVRKDLGAVCGAGRPRVGYDRAELTASLEDCLGGRPAAAVIVGAGKLAVPCWITPVFRNTAPISLPPSICTSPPGATAASKSRSTPCPCWRISAPPTMSASASSPSRRKRRRPSPMCCTAAGCGRSGALHPAACSCRPMPSSSMKIWRFRWRT